MIDSAQRTVAFQSYRLFNDGAKYIQSVQQQKELEKQKEKLQLEDQALELELWGYEKKEKRMMEEMSREGGEIGSIVGGEYLFMFRVSGFGIVR